MSSRRSAKRSGGTLRNLDTGGADVEERWTAGSGGGPVYGITGVASVRSLARLSPRSG
jgi:hypothetical protein